jgi:hypothetical protein
VHLKAQIIRELDRLEVVLEQLKTVEAERDALLKPASDEAASPAAMLAQLKASAPRPPLVASARRTGRAGELHGVLRAFMGLNRERCGRLRVAPSVELRRSSVLKRAGHYPDIAEDAACSCDPERHIMPRLASGKID